MKYAIILPDGAVDEPVASLGGATPLRAARTPHMDRIARDGLVGRVVTVPDGFSPGSDVATLSLMGYDPAVYHTGRAPLEAVARDITAGEGQLIFRCNLVTIEDGRMRDFTAGHISQVDADALIRDMNGLFAGGDVRFHTGVSYRNLMVASGIDPDVKASPPHDIPDELVVDHLPEGEGAYAVRSIMQRAHDMLADHPVNKRRMIEGDPMVTDVWLWGQGRATSLPSLADRYGLRFAAIAAVDIVRGIAKAAGMSLIEVPGATGYLDTDYAAKGRTAANALDEFDVVVVHVEAPDEAGHLGDAAAKVEAIERVDGDVVGPILRKLGTFADSRVLIAPDHPTPVEKRVHTANAPAFCMMGRGIKVDSSKSFDEEAAAASGLVVKQGHTLLDQFLTRS